MNTGETVVFPESSRLRNPIFVETSRLQAIPHKSIFNEKQQLPQFQKIRQFNSNPTFQRQQQQQQQNEHGYSYPYPAAVPPVHETVDESTPDDQEETTGTSVIAVANASGQYYILGKDNTLQRVMYRTAQTEDDVNSDGFTAQLHYTPVEPIRDPVYGYDDQGHLVRIFNKK